MFIVLVLYIFLKIGRFAPLVSRPAREIDLKTHVQGSPQSRASLNTLVKYYSWRQRTELPLAR